MKWLVAYLSGVVTSVISAILLGFLCNGLNKTIAIASLIIGFLFGLFIILRYLKLSAGIKKRELGIWSWIAIIVFLVFCLRAFLWLVFRRGDGLHVLCSTNFGDISYHILYIKYFANGIPFWPDSPIFTGSKIHYYFGIDLFNSLLILTGMDLIQSLIWVGILGSFATGFSLLIWGRAFTLAGFLLTGGLAGFKFFQTQIFADYQADLEWKNVFLAMFIPQRGFLHALPAGLLLLSSWRQRFFNANGDSQETSLILPLWIEILLYSSMPIFHLHTFIFLSLLLGIWLIVIHKSKRIELVHLLSFSLVPASIFVLFVTDFLKGGGMIHLDLTWIKSFQGILKYWLYNFGIFWPLIIVLCYKLITEHKNTSIFSLIRNNNSTAFIFPAILLFILFSVVILSTWSYDNAKLLLWSYLILLPYVWKNLISTWDNFSRYVACFLLFFSGFVCIVGSLDVKKAHEIYKISYIYDISSAVRELPIQGRFAAFPTHNHPLLFCGRKVVLGYPGWIWSQGYPLEEKDEKLKKLMLGDKNWLKLAKELGVRYIFWGEREKHEYATSTKPWEMSATKIVSGEWGTIYDL